MKESDDPNTIGAIGTMFTVLEAIVESGGTVGVTELSDQLDMPKSTVFKHLNTLTVLGYLQRNGREYVLGTRIVDLGQHVLSRTDLYFAAKNHVDRLTDLTNETVGLVVENNGYATDLYWASHRSEPTPEIGTSRHLHCSAAGKAILAQFSQSETEKLLGEMELTEITDNTIVSADKLLAELDRVRERGIAFERGEQYPNINSVAVPLSTVNRRAALYVMGNDERLSSKRIEEDIPGILLSNADKIAKQF
jgi:DNA-binding IclR family transcriptional regulator